MLSLQFVLLGCLFIAQGLCHTLPELKARAPRDTSNIPTHLFKPVGGNSGQENFSGRSSSKGNRTVLRFRRDTSNIPTHFFKPVGEQSSNEPFSDRSSYTGSNGTSNVEFFEKSSGEVEEVTASYEDEDLPSRPIPHQPRPFPQNFPRTNGFRSPPNFPRNPSDFNAGPSGSRFNNNHFISSQDFHGSALPVNLESQFRNENSGISDTYSINAQARGIVIPTIIGGDMFVPQRRPNGPWDRNPGFSESGSISAQAREIVSPTITGGSTFVPQRRPNGPRDPSGNFYRSESYSYTSDGRGPPQVQRDVYDSRDGFGSSFRNF
ncbi:hypothetical protein KR084_010369 [Drosophila pseudotakahashii]|nr:hypothetical protein KR084_010369 [Drosophila pseudotakahashii]